MRLGRPIMLIEDDLVDRMSVRRALSDLRAINPLIEASDGEEALRHLRDPDNMKPGIILLDLNMPRMNGIEFLRELKADEALKVIPVLVLTSSKETRDRLDAFGLGAAGFMVKPVDYDDFVEMMEKVLEYWRMNELLCHTD